MTVRCAQCGEEMLGAVNRCWKCGSKLVANPEQPDLPPMRRVTSDLFQPPLPHPDDIADAELIDDEAAEFITAEAVTAEPPPRGEGGAPPTAAAANTHAPVRHSVPIVERERLSHQHPMRHATAATGGAIGSLLLGISSLVISLFTLLGALVAFVGLALGAWGASSNRRNMAFLGMLLCCLALLITGYRGSIWAYEFIYGYSPFESSLPAGYEGDYGPPLDPMD